MDVAVVGGGPAGLFAALRLRQTLGGAKVTVYERLPRPSTPGGSGGRHVSVTLNVRGLLALRRAGLAPTGVPLDGIVPAPQPFAPYDGPEPALVVRRHDLWTLLLDAAEASGVRVVFGCRAEPCGQGELALLSPHSGIVAPDLIVGADGARSAVRWPGAEVADHGLAYWEGASVEASSPGVRPHALYLWQGAQQFALGLPAADGSLAVAIYGDRPWLLRLRAVSPTERRAALAEVIPDLPSDLRWSGDSPGELGRLTSVLPSSLAQGNTVLVGDAAHAMLPFLGQGLNSSLWEVNALCDRLASAPGAPLDRQLAAHSEQLLPGLRLLVAESRAARPGPGLASAPGAFFRLAAHTELDYAEAHRQAGVRCDWAKVGDEVRVGEVLATVRAVKTETVVRAQRAGLVTAVSTDERGVPSFEIAPAASAPASAPPPLVVGSPADGFDGALLQQSLRSRRIGRFVGLRALTTTTMDDARREAAAGAPHGAVFLAEEMTAGRGRGGRSWASVRGRNLYATFVLRDVADLVALHFAAAVAVAEACHAVGASDARLKWPNDVLDAQGGKLSGLLIDAEADGVALLGIGVNVCAVPGAVAGVASSVEAVAGRPVQREEVLAELCGRLEALLELSTPLLRERFEALDSVSGRDVVVYSKSGNGDEVLLRGFASAVDAQGALLVDGRALTSSEVSVRVAPDGRRAIRVFSGDGTGADGVRRALEALASEPGGRIVRAIGATELRLGQWMEATDVLVLPGGAEQRFPDGIEPVIRRFVEEEGGHYLGICAGAYFACAKVEFDVGGPLEVRGERPLAFFPGAAVGPVLPGFAYGSEAGAGRVVLQDAVYGPSAPVYVNGGCLFPPPPPATSAGFEVLASYPGGAGAAVVRCVVGAGTAVLSGVHPEWDGGSEFLWSLLR